METVRQTMEAINARRSQQVRDFSMRLTSLHDSASEALEQIRRQDEEYRCKIQEFVKVVGEYSKGPVCFFVENGQTQTRQKLEKTMSGGARRRSIGSSGKRRNR